MNLCGWLTKIGRFKLQANTIHSTQQIDQKLLTGQPNIEAGKPKVSILIISYNQKDYVAEALESAINQDYENLEVVISDDGSTDGTAEIIAEWQFRYPKRLIALLNRDNVGITRNTNRGLHACTGDFIAFQGGDDILLPGKITAQVNWFEQDRHRVLCGHLIEKFYQDGSKSPHVAKIKLLKGSGPTEIIQHGVPYGATSIMVRASEIPPYGCDEKIPSASDFLLWIEVLSSGGEYGYVDVVYARARRHNSNITNRVFDMLDDIEQTFLLVSERYPRYRVLCADSIIKHVIYTSGVCHLKEGNKGAARERFIATIQKKPLFVKAWIRLFQTF